MVLVCIIVIKYSTLIFMHGLLNHADIILYRVYYRPHLPGLRVTDITLKHPRIHAGSHNDLCSYTPSSNSHLSRSDREKITNSCMHTYQSTMSAIVHFSKLHALIIMFLCYQIHFLAGKKRRKI